ncbi:LacI family DNA-binding transcriptional regulator [Burkholderia sp. S-53]|uniref:LacI family DNA-binding transcriptional regulator n=1 Tax=Burkholderia sp. S-53 TaxID=2906514 RepID=UPI0021D26153|nr:LacI family DNA-binding transcriptional regulator [Burkholderia sp. S-53]UXU85825.1 LacI family transcriptional regulator [Burkholderia sp. S-53]
MTVIDADHAESRFPVMIHKVDPVRLRSSLLASRCLDERFIYKTISMQPKVSVTIREIAERAGVSVSTVSLVLRESPLVAEVTRQKVLAAIDELGYVYNRSAASMRSRRSGVVAISVNDLSNPYFAGLTSSVERALYQLGRTVLLSDVREDADRQAHFIEKMREHGVDGLILCPAHSTDIPRLVAQLKTAQLPCVLVSRNLPGSDLDYVGYDHCYGMRLAVEHLITLGHRRIALLGGNRSTWVGKQRLKGYREALRAHGLDRDPAQEIPGELTRTSGMELIGRALSLPKPPTAAACANDVVAFGVMLGLRRWGLEPGRDFSVTGNDDVAEAALWTPALTTVSTDFELIGERAAHTLLQRANDPCAELRHLNLPVHLRVRESTAVLRVD